MRRILRKEIEVFDSEDEIFTMMIIKEREYENTVDRL